MAVEGGIGDSLEYRHTAFRGPVFPPRNEARSTGRTVAQEHGRIALERIFDADHFDRSILLSRARKGLFVARRNLSFFKARCDSRGRGDFDAVDSDRKRERKKEDILSLDFGWLIRIFSVSIRVRKSVLSASNPRPRVGGTGFVHACDTRLGVCRTRCTYESGTSSF